MIWEKGGKKGEDSRRREPHFFCLASQHRQQREEDSLSFAVSFLVFAQKKPTRSGGPWDVSSFVELDTKRKDDESGETYTEFFEKKKRIGGGFFPVKCVFERDWKRNSSQNRHCDALVDERELQTSSSCVMAQRCVDLSLSVCVCVFLFCVFATDTFWSREEVGSFFSYILRLEKKSPTKNPKRADWLGKKLHMRIARAVASRSFLSCTQTPND